MCNSSQFITFVILINIILIDLSKQLLLKKTSINAFTFFRYRIVLRFLLFFFPIAISPKCAINIKYSGKRKCEKGFSMILNQLSCNY